MKQRLQPEKHLQPTQAQRAAADLWLIRRDGNGSTADEASFQRWLGEDTRHVIAYREAALLWTHLEAPAARLADQTRLAARRQRNMVGRGLFRWWATLPLTTAAAATAFVWIAYPSIFENIGADIVTARGEATIRELPDGSRLTIGADSALDLDFKDGRRRVVIRRGEAFFDVKPGPAPFFVNGGDSEVRVLGTAFNVDRTTDGVDVAVKRGSVAVADPTHRSVTLTADQHVAIADGQLGKVGSGDLDNRLAWISGRLVFDRAPLHRVVATLQRQTRSRIVVRGGYADLEISGTFPTANVDDSLAAIAAMIDGRIAHLTPWVTVIY
jgi:transmembrane sensor